MNLGRILSVGEATDPVEFGEQDVVETVAAEPVLVEEPATR